MSCNTVALPQKPQRPAEGLLDALLRSAVLEQIAAIANGVWQR